MLVMRNEDFLLLMKNETPPRVFSFPAHCERLPSINANALSACMRDFPVYSPAVTVSLSRRVLALKLGVFENDLNSSNKSYAWIVYAVIPIAVCNGCSTILIANNTSNRRILIHCPVN